MQLLLSAAHEAGAKIAVHLEPYKSRSASSVREDLAYLFHTYGHHPAFYRDHLRGNLPVIYV